MKCALALLALCATATALPAEYIEANEAALWESFKAEHHRSYSAAEEPFRRATFKKNMLEYARLERGSKTGATFGATKFSDLTAEEFKVFHSLSIPSDVLAAGEAVPSLYSETEVLRASGGSVDWRTKKAVTAVKNQAQCGSCWSFSTTGTIEGHHAVKEHSLVSLSEQELVSCSKEDSGCGGGWQELAMDWLVKKRHGQIVTEKAYPYVSGGGSVPACRVSSDMEVGATITGSKILPQDEDQIATYLIKNAPVAITVDASSWSGYTGGVMDNCSGTSLDHAVLAVGVTPDYWIVKNSWGASWGESGYIRLARGQNTCAMKNHVVVPTL